MRRMLLLALVAVAVACGSNPSRQVAHRELTPREAQPPRDVQKPIEAQPTLEAQTARDGQTVPQTENDELTVYVTDTGQRYHLSTCRTLRSTKHPISIGEAKRRGYTPCKVCQPPR